MSDSRRPSDVADKMLVRLPDGMREQILAASERSGRSMNAEVVARLAASFESDEQARELADRVSDNESDILDFEKRIESLERRMDDVYHMAGWKDFPGND